MVRRKVWGGRSPTHIIVVCVVTTVYLCYQVWLQVKPCVSVAVVMSVRTHSLSVTCHSLAVYSTIVQHVVETQVNHIRKVWRTWMGLHVHFSIGWDYMLALMLPKHCQICLLFSVVEL